MPTSPIAPTALPPAPNPSVRATFSGLAYTWSVALPQLGTDLTALATNAFNNAVETNASAANSLAQANNSAASAISASNSLASTALQVQLALDAAQMKGNWSSLTGALNKPASVANGGKIWALLNNLADVTTSQPGVTTDWVDITPAPSAYVCNHDQGLVTLTSSSTHSLAGVVALDAVRALLIIQSPANIHAVVYNNTTKLFGTAVLVRTGLAAAAGATSVLVATDRVLIASCPGTTAFEVVVLSMTGSSIAVGTAVSATLPEACTLRDNFVAAGSSYVLALRGASNARAIAITVSGTIPTVGTSVIGVAGITNSLPLLRSIDATRVLLAGTSSTTLFYAVPITVSAGTTLVVGTVATTACNGSAYTLAALSTGRWAAIYTNTATQGAIISVAGTVATLSIVALGTGASLNSAGVKVGDQIIVASEAGLVNVLTDVAGVATAGTAISANTGTSGNASPVAYGSDYAVFANNLTTSANWSVIKISGNNPYLFEYGNAVIGGVPTNGGPGLSGTPDCVLSISGKSAMVLPNNGGGFAIQFGSTLKILLLPPMASNNGAFKQSASVVWVGYGLVSATNIRINRLELV